MTRARLICLLTLSSAGLWAAAEEKVRAAEKSWASAVVRQDFAALETKIDAQNGAGVRGNGGIPTRLKNADGALYARKLP